MYLYSIVHEGDLDPINNNIKDLFVENDIQTPEIAYDNCAS